MIRIEYNICVEDWIYKVESEKERIQSENLIKELSCLAYWNVRNVTIPRYSSVSLQESDDYIYEFIVNGRLRAVIYARRNDSNTVDIITTML